MELTISVLSQAGGQAVNQDAYGVWSTADSCFCVLSDGAGGHLGGEVASKLAVKHVLDWFCRTSDASASALPAALASANQALIAEQGRTPEVANMRATVLVLILDTLQASACWGYIGDTRLYCFRGGHIITQTRDHSVVQNMVDAGYLNAVDLRAAPGRNALLAALGDPVHCKPTLQDEPFPVLPGDVFLLCTDGFWEYITEPEMVRTLLSAESPEAWLSMLEARVMEQGCDGQDNYSAIAIWCSHGADQAKI